LDDPSNSPGAKDIDKLTFRDFCVTRAQSEDVAGFADLICAALLGVESNEVSALFMLHYFKSGTGIDNLLSDQKDGGQYLRNRQGTCRS
jgi:monoamine oxidase